MIETIWLEFRGELSKHLEYHLFKKEDTEDLLQEIFLKLIKALRQEGNIENMRAYLYGIARNTLYDYYRENGKKGEKIEYQEGAYYDITHSGIEEDSIRQIIDCCLQVFINKLPIAYRHPLLLSDIENKKQNDIANELGISYNNTKIRIQRGRKKLREYIDACCASDKREGKISCSSDVSFCKK